MADTRQQIRVNGQLLNTTTEETQDLAKKAGLPAAPATPAGADAIGANPDQAKMAGVRNAGQAAPSTVSLKTPQTLQGAERTVNPNVVQTDADRAKAAKATSLEQLGGLGDQVQALVNQQLAGMSAAAGPVRYNDAQFKTLQPSVDQTALKTLLSTYQTAVGQLAGTTDPAARATLTTQVSTALAALQNTYGIKDPESYLDTSTGTLGTTAAEQVMNPDQVTVGTLDTSKLGLAPADIDGLLGPGWQSLSVGDFRQRVEDLRQKEFARVRGLQAQLATAAPGSLQARALHQELMDAGQAGVTGVEQGVSKLAETLDSADIVTVGNKQFKIADLLKDDAISALVVDFLNPSGDPAAKDALKKTNPELVKWIETHRDGLTSLAKEMGTSQESFGALQEAHHALATVAPDVTLNPAVMRALDPDWDKAVGTATDLSGSSVYAAVKADPKLASKLNLTPGVVADLAKLTPEQIADASKKSDALGLDTVLQKLMGITDPTKVPAFLTDPTSLQRMARFTPVLATLRAAGGDLATLVEDKDFQNLIQTGQIDAATAQALVKNPKAYAEYTAQKDLYSQFRDLERHPEPDAVYQLLFGDKKVTAASVKTLHDQLAEAVKYDPSDTTSATRLASLEKYTGSDGVLSATEQQTLLDRMRTAISSPNIRDVVKLPADGKAALNFNTAGINPMEGAKQSTFVDQLKTMLSDGKIDRAELDSMLPAERDKLFAMDPKWLQSHNVTSSDEYHDAAVTDETTKLLNGIGISRFDGGGTRNQDIQAKLRANPLDLQALLSTMNSPFLDNDKLHAATTAVQQLKGLEAKTPALKQQIRAQIDSINAMIDNAHSYRQAMLAYDLVYSGSNGWRLVKK